MNNIDKIAEAMNDALIPDATRLGLTPIRSPEVVLRTFARMGWRAHKYPAPDRAGVVGPEDPQWTLGVGTLILTDGQGVSERLLLDWNGLTGMASATLDEYQELAEGILAAVEIARELDGGRS